MNIGLFGFGCVGQGLWQVLHETKGVQAEIRRICIKHPDKARSIAPRYFTTRAADILDDPDIDVVVELIDDAEAAFEIVSAALLAGKAVVSANKKMIAHRLPELYALQQRTGTPFLYEGACCASIPIIRNLEEYYDNDLLSSVEGVFNGTTNVILTKVFEQKMSFEQALRYAQEHGFAERDPTLDVEGFDPKFKLCILLLHAFGVFVEPDRVFNYGIGALNGFDIAFAQSRDCVLKLVARCYRHDDRVAAYCLPRFVPKGHRYEDVRDEYNAVTLESAFSERQVFVGKGAGDKPTGCAVLSDISALRYRYRYEYRKFGQNDMAFDLKDTVLKVYVRHSYEGQVAEGDFLAITERYVSEQARYWVGTIQLEKLQHASWLHTLGVNVIECN
ncbi:MAG TPA: homoserine dehydrogenase [Saprospiraceae bacterium]|nr:homoserine dehydrogenase [Saprospiraceae bacterium]HND88437.1 homoserine dehydrogenase [Saprospiraceae bacterium]